MFGPGPSVLEDRPDGGIVGDWEDGSPKVFNSKSADSGEMAVGASEPVERERPTATDRIDDTACICALSASRRGL